MAPLRNARFLATHWGVLGGNLRKLCAKTGLIRAFSLIQGKVLALLECGAEPQSRHIFDVKNFRTWKGGKNPRMMRRSPLN